MIFVVFDVIDAKRQALAQVLLGKAGRTRLDRVREGGEAMKEENVHWSITKKLFVPLLAAILLVSLMADIPEAHQDVIGISSTGTPDIVLLNHPENPLERAGELSNNTLVEIRRAIQNERLGKIFDRVPGRIAADERQELAGMFITAGEESGIDPLFLAALVWEESGFVRDAVSSRDAHGLMQVRPATAGEVAQKLAIQAFSPGMLEDPATNIRIGVFYLHELLQHYRGSYLLAVTAYNRGPNALRQLIRKYGWLQPRFTGYYRKVLQTYQGFRHGIASPLLTFLEHS